MGFLRLLGFSLIVLLVIAGLDYYQQDKKSEGTLSAQGYMDTVKLRFAQLKAEKDYEQLERDRKKRWRAGAEPYVPAAGSDWARRAIVDRDYTRDAREGVLQDNISEAARPLAKKVAVQKVEQLARKLDRTSWVYEKDGYTIWLQVRLKENASSHTLTGNIVKSMDTLGTSGRDYAPFGIIGGVAYFQFEDSRYSAITVDDRAFWSMVTASITDLGDEAPFEIYKGTIGLGQEVRLKLFSDAPKAEVAGFLAQLDYDGMNALLSRPVPGVQNGVTVPPEATADLATEMAGLRREFMKLRGELARLKLENIDGLALLANNMMAQYGLPDGTFDLTANRIESGEDLVQVGYRQGLSDLLSDELQKADAGNVFSRLMASFYGSGAAKEEEETGEGFFAGLTGFFQKDDKAEAPVVRINKGRAGVSSECATKGRTKTCTMTDG